MKIAIDIHDTIDARPHFFSMLTKLLKVYGVKIYITTGVPITPKVREQLAKWGIEYDVLFSITGYHEANGTTIKWDEKGDPWIEEEIWDRTKADYCKWNDIDLAIDDSTIYGKYFDTPYLLFDKKNIKMDIEIVERVRSCRI